MNFSYKYSNILLTPFERSAQGTYLNNQNYFSFDYFIDIDCTQPVIEIPTINLHSILTTLTTNINILPKDKISNIVIPLWKPTISCVKNTSDSILKFAFIDTRFDIRIRKILTLKNETYYGGRGIILNKDFEPLLLCTMDAVKDKVFATYNTINPTIHINNKIFLEEKGLISTHIIKKMIPFYSTHTFRGEKFKIVIENMENYLKKPAKPSIETFSNEAINDLLVENMTELLQTIKI